MNQNYNENDEEIIEESIESFQIINDNILYKSSDFISKPIKSEKCTMDENILQLQYPLSNRFLTNFIFFKC